MKPTLIYSTSIISYSWGKMSIKNYSQRDLFKNASLLIVYLSSAFLSTSSANDLRNAETDGNCQSADVPVDAIFAVDTSSSLRVEEYTLAMQFVARFVAFLGEVFLIFLVTESRFIRGFIRPSLAPSVREFK